MSHFARQEDNRTNPVRRSYPNGLLLSFSSSSSSSLSSVPFVQWVTWDTNAVQFLSRINEEVISRSTLLPKTPVTIKTNIKGGNLVLDKRSLTAYFNGLVLPHLDYTDIVWGDQTGLTTRMKQLQSFQNRFAIKIVKAKWKQMGLWHCRGGPHYMPGVSVVYVVLYKMYWRVWSLKISMC